jgi:hypothetical protein
MDLRRFCGSSGRRQSRARAKGAVKRKALRAGLDVVAEDTTYKGFRLRPGTLLSSLSREWLIGSCRRN